MIFYVILNTIACESSSIFYYNVLIYSTMCDSLSDKYSFEEYLNSLSKQDIKDYIEENKADTLLSSIDYLDYIEP